MNSWLLFGLLFVLFLVFSIIIIICICNGGNICINMITYICGPQRDPLVLVWNMICLTFCITGLLFCILYTIFLFLN